MILPQVKPRDFIYIPNGDTRTGTTCFGIAKGAKVICAEKLPKEPAIIVKGREEAAIERKLAENIKAGRPRRFSA